MSQVQHKPSVVIPEKILIRNIKITNALVNAPSEKGQGLEEVAIHISARTFFSDNHDCRIILISEFSLENDKGIDEIKASFTIQFDFEIENIEDFLIYSTDTEGTEEKTVQVDANLGATLMGIAYSTARGIILTRTGGTALEGIVLPVVDPMTLVKSST
jgi:hypothetical protein